VLQDYPAGHGVQVTAPSSEVDPGSHFVIIGSPALMNPVSVDDKVQAFPIGQ
jgi:hypothetical protein